MWAIKGLFGAVLCLLFFLAAAEADQQLSAIFEADFRGVWFVFGCGYVELLRCVKL